nr:hypothetical protein [Streptomyces sp. SID9727]
MASALGTVVSSASAATTGTWTVTPAGAFTAPHANYPTFRFPALFWACRSFDVTAGKLEATGTTGSGLGTIDSVVGSCPIGGIEYTVTKSAPAWAIDIVGQNPSHTNWVDVRISGVSTHWAGFGCVADVKGTLYGHYENDTGNLVISDTSGGLIASNVNCMGLINDGDVVTLKSSWHMAMASTGKAPLIKTS